MSDFDDDYVRRLFPRKSEGGIPKLVYYYDCRPHCPECFEARDPMPTPYIGLCALAASDSPPVHCTDCGRLLWAQQ